jgi:hypothetical protein
VRPGLGLAGLALLTFVGCHHPATTAPTGRSSFEFVDPPPAPPAKSAVANGEELIARDKFVPARPAAPLAGPVYPPAALAAGAGRVTVGVRLTVDGSGRVASVGWSPLCLSTPTPHAAAFLAAVEAAVALWQFEPAAVEHFEKARGEAAEGLVDYWRLARRETVDATCDVSFTFSATGSARPVTAAF